VYDRLVRWLIVVAVAGCKFREGSLSDVDAAVTSEVDAASPDAPSPDAAPPNCYAQWLDGTIQLDTPVALAAVNASAYDRDPFLTDDELTLYFASGRTGSTGGGSVFKATRAEVTDAFGTPVLDAQFDSLQSETKVSITADGLAAVVGSNRTGSMGVDVWTSTRASTSVAFPAFTKAAGVNTSGNDQDPTISADGLHLYIAPDTGGTQKIVVATRAALGDTFGAPTTVINSGSGDADPSPTPDERILVFASNRVLAGGGNGDIWYATRASASDAFGTPKAVPGANTGMPEGDPHLSADGCRLYFARNVRSTDYDLFVAAAAQD